ncbi:MAG: TlpA disulfide reductase family protein [Cruoricaptor ignavus]|nr:TlpA disulfide reductase family protein [Cruoricaptor ignavus]
MKKILIPFLVFATIIACKKNEKVTDAENQPSDSNSTITETIDNKKDNIIPEYDIQQIAELINTKNDTLYVTNFFATWCGPCLREMPHFTKKIEELNGQPVKFTFISVDDKKDWDSKVQRFGDQFGVSDNIVLTDAMAFSSSFFNENFTVWDGSSIPFTMMRKGDKVNETVGMMSKNQLDEKISAMMR